MKLPYIALIIVLLPGFLNGTPLNAQENLLKYHVALQTGYNGPGTVPFWLRSNQFGSIPPEGPSAGLIGAIGKDFNRQNAGIADWGFSAEVRANLGKTSDLTLIEGYVKFRLAMFTVKAGRSKDIMGLCDTSLTSGSFVQSGNALGIPKIELSVPEFRELPFFGRLFAVKGNFAHGWMGRTKKDFDTVQVSSTYLHQKSLYVRFGKPEWKIKLYGGFNHQVVWGNEGDFMGEDYALNLTETYWYVITGKPYNNLTIQKTRVGNHLGSVDVGIELDLKNISILAYRQNFYDAEALLYFANILDGLNGLSITNKSNNVRTFQWKRLLIEFLHTKNQGGEVWSKETPSPFENYYNNGYYTEGWSYEGTGLGTPFIVSGSSLTNRFPTAPYEFFANNRVMAIHFGLMASFYEWEISSKLSYSRNYGTYRTASEGKITSDIIYPSPYGVFPETDQFSIFISAARTIQGNLIVGLKAALDAGNLYENTFGILCFVSKSIW